MLDKRTQDDFNRLFDQLPTFNADETEKQEYANHCRRLADLNPSCKPLSFTRWKEQQTQRGNPEGQNND